MVVHNVVLLEWDFTTTLFSELVICWKQLSVAKSWFRHLTKKTLKAFWASTQTHWVLVEQLLVPLKCRAARQLAEETTAYPCSRGKNLPTGILEMRRVTFLPEPDFCFALSVNHSLWDLNDVTLAYGDGYCDAVKTTKIVSSIDFYMSKQRERFTRFRFWGIYDIVSTDLRLFCHFLWTGFIFKKGVWNQTPYYCHFKSLTISMFFLEVKL